MPVVFFDVGGYYEHLFRFFDDAAGAGLLRPLHRAMAQRATEVAEALRMATSPAPPTGPKWTDASAPTQARVRRSTRGW